MCYTFRITSRACKFLIRFVTCPNDHSRRIFAYMPTMTGSNVGANGCMAKEGADIALALWQSLRVSASHVCRELNAAP